MRDFAKVCALGLAFATGAIIGEPAQVQATHKAITAGPVETAGKAVRHSHEAVKWAQGTYKVIYKVVEATGYAPLDPKAVKGMCYSGNPHVTASGARTKPGVTVAAPTHVPFGTKVLVPGYGLRAVEDRGGAIRKGRIDICFRTQREALAFGRKKIEIMILEEA